MQYSVKQEMKAFILKNTSDNELEKIVISNSDITSSSSDFRFNDDNEFIYKGKFYDIVRQKSDGSNTIFYCVNDTNEEKLFAGLDEHVKQNMDQNLPVKGKSAELLKNIIKEALPDNSITICSNQQNFNIHFIYNSLLKEHYISILSPPPKS